MFFTGALYFVRFLDYSLALGLFGYLFLYICTFKTAPPRKKLTRLFAASLLASFVWMIISALDMADGWDKSAILYALTHTTFAHWWCIRIGLLLAATLLAMTGLESRLRRFTILGMSAAVPLFASLTSHASTSETWPWLKIGLDYFHQLSAGIWFGGLIGLYINLGQSPEVELAPDSIYRVVKRFSHIAMISTGVLFTTGAVQTLMTEQTLWVLWSSAYGKLIFIKLLLFGASLLIAAINQFIHLKHFKSGQESSFARAIRRELRLEFVLIFFVLAVTSILTRSNLPG